MSVLFLDFTSTTLDSFSLFFQILRRSLVSAKLGILVCFDFIFADMVLFVDVHLSTLLSLVVHLIFVGVLVSSCGTCQVRVASDVLRVEPCRAYSIKWHSVRNGRISAFVIQILIDAALSWLTAQSKDCQGDRCHKTSADLPPQDHLI